MIGRRIAVHFGLIDIGILLGLLIAVTVLVRRHECVLLNTGSVTLYAANSKYCLRQ